MTDSKTLSEVYLPAEQLLVDRLYQTIQDQIREKKKIQLPGATENQKEECLEYFLITDFLISFSRRGGGKAKSAVKPKEVKDAIRYALRTDEELNKKSFNKMYNTPNYDGIPLFLIVNLVMDEIVKHRVVGQEISHNAFGKGIISKMELEKNFAWFKSDDDNKKLSMDYFALGIEDQLKITGLIAGA